MKLITRFRLIAAVKKSDLPKKDKSQIIKILLTHNLEKALPLILRTLGTALKVFEFFSQRE